MDASKLSDAQWEKLRPLLPPQKPRTGRPANDHRTVLEGILWVLRTGCPWRSLPACYGSWKTVSSGGPTRTAGSTGPCTWSAGP